MYQIALILNNTDANVSVSYKTKEAAERVYKDIVDLIDTRRKLVLEIPDDFGYILAVKIPDISYALFIDVEQSQFCQHEKNVALAKASKKLLDIVQSDPELMTLLQLGQQGKRSPILQ